MLSKEFERKIATLEDLPELREITWQMRAARISIRAFFVAHSFFYAFFLLLWRSARFFYEYVLHGIDIHFP